MFGMGFSEILIIAVIAILFLGPDKLPSTMVEIAKFFRSFKNAVGSVKQTIEDEMQVSEIKQEALAYKKQLLDAGETLEKATDVKGAINTGLASLEDDIALDETPKKAPQQPQEVTFKKKNKKKDIDDV